MKTNKDYQDDLKKALIELDEQKRKPRDKENDFLNIILGILVVMIVIVGIVGAVMIGKTYVNLEPKDPIVNNDIVIDNNEQKDDIDQDDDQNQQDIIDNTDENIDDQINDDTNQQVSGIIDITNEEDGDFKVLEFRISKEDNQVRFDIQSETKIAGNIFLKDDQSLNIGPISVNSGSNELYFLINGQNNYELHFNSSDGREYIYKISKEDIKNAINE